MKKFKFNRLVQALSFTVIVPFFLSGCNSGQSAETAGTTSGATSTKSATAAATVTPVITMINNSQTSANCAYFITRPDGEPYGQTINKQAKNIVPGSTVTWNYIDTIDDYQNGKSFTSSTKTSVCSYNLGWGPLGPNSEEGAYYITHNSESNTLTFIGYGLASSKTTVSCTDSLGKSVSKTLVNDNYSQFTCDLNKSSAITITLSGNLSQGKNLMNQQVPEQDTLSFSSGGGSEATCMLDNNTGLMWVKDLKTVPVIGSQAGSVAGNIPATSYQNVIATIAEMNKNGYCGHNDWRLPSINEMSSLINYTAKNPQTYLATKGFANLAPGDGDYWTSTNFAPNQEAPWAGYNWISMMSETGKGRTAFAVGTYSTEVKQPSALYVWPVRNASATSNAATPILATSDKAINGKAWPTTRFIPDASGQCMVDKLTGLTWVKDQANLQTIGASNVLALYKDAKATVERMNATGYCGVKDWHLPSVKELGTLVNYNKPDFAAWLNSQGFNMHKAGNYWNSFWTGSIVAETVSPGFPGRVWYMNSDGEFTFGIQSNMLNVFPVTSAKVKEGKPLAIPTPTPAPSQLQKYPAGIGSYAVGSVVLGRDNKQYTCLVEAACNYAYSDAYYDPVIGQWANFAWQTSDATPSKYPYFPNGIGSYVNGTVVINANGEYYKCLDKQFCNLGDASDAPLDKFPNNMTWQKISAADLEPKPTPTPTPAPTPLPTPTGQYPEYNASAGNYVKGSMVSRNGNQYRCLVADYCNNAASASFYAPATGTYATSAWELVNYKSYSSDAIFLVYPEGKSKYLEGDIVTLNGKQYRCINTAACSSNYSGYAPTASYGDPAWSPVTNTAQIYPAGIGTYYVGDVVIGSDGKQYRCKDKSGCNYNNGKYYDPVSGAYTATAWTKVN